MPLYELTEDADADVEEIVRYTLGEWGEEQAGQTARAPAPPPVLSPKGSPSFTTGVMRRALSKWDSGSRVRGDDGTRHYFRVNKTDHFSRLAGKEETSKIIS